jgi:hypothetical protein
MIENPVLGLKEEVFIDPSEQARREIHRALAVPLNRLVRKAFPDCTNPLFYSPPQAQKIIDLTEYYRLNWRPESIISPFLNLISLRQLSLACDMPCEAIAVYERGGEKYDEQRPFCFGYLLIDFSIEIPHVSPKTAIHASVHRGVNGGFTLHEQAIWGNRNKIACCRRMIAVHPRLIAVHPRLIKVYQNIPSQFEEGIEVW